MLVWTESPIPQQAIDAFFASLGVIEQGDAVGPLPHQTFSGGYELD